MNISRAVGRRREFLRTWLLWTAGFLAFPLAGLAGGALAGRVDDPLAGLVGGAVSGLVIGTGQVLVGRGRLDAVRWIPAATLPAASSQIGASS